jgi:hypothetical protein
LRDIGLNARKSLKIESLPKNLNSFKRIWSNISKYVANKCAQSLMQGRKRKLRAVANGRVLEPYKLNDK